MKPEDKLAEEIDKLLKDWLQCKDSIIFTDNIAINEITDDIIEIFQEYHEAKLKEELIEYELTNPMSNYDKAVIYVDEYLKQREK